MRFVSSDKITIYVGKNNRQNDALTLSSARSENIWLHAKNIPGSHVIIDYEGEPPETTLREAAMLAAFYSQACASSGVPVDYTPRKFVKKPAGARPGMMIYSTNRTLYVTPDNETILRLRENAEQQ
jgi:predicted ribosome quality control (RQC) complex YloA/Tae2 family protein